MNPPGSTGVMFEDTLGLPCVNLFIHSCFFDSGLDLAILLNPWTGEMFICTIHGVVHYSWIVEM